MKTLKTKAFEWIISQCTQHSLNYQPNVLMDCPFYFKLEGFADEPEVFIRTTIDGLEFGYEATQWDGPVPSPLPSIFTKQTISWESLKLLSEMEQYAEILELLLKTINSRKRQYRKCQFCGVKVAIEHRIDNDTCHDCASEHLGVVF